MRYHMNDVDTGEEVVLDLPVHEAPEFGKILRRKGRRLMRPVPRAGDIQRPCVKADLKVIGWGLPPGVPGATAYMNEHTREITNDPNDVPLYDSERDLQATAKATNGEITHDRLLKGKK